jgi:ABC-type molybdate transport system permease subunit
MTFPITVACGKSNTRALVTKRGQQVVAPLEYSEFYTATTVSNNVAVNVIKPRTGKNFAITDIILSGDRSIGANGAVTQVYENTTGPTDTTITKLIYADEIAKQTRAVLTGLNIIVTVGSWVNVVSDDVQVRANIAGYYITNGQANT